MVVVTGVRMARTAAAPRVDSSDEIECLSSTCRRNLYGGHAARVDELGRSLATMSKVIFISEHSYYKMLVFW